VSAPPKTVLVATPEEEREIRERVRTVDPATLGFGRALANESHVDGLIALLSDPQVSDPIYDLPRPFTRESVTAWIKKGESARQNGDGLLFVTAFPDGEVIGYSKVTVWPDRSSAELGGALKASRQNSGSGGAGAAQTIGWIFSALGVRLIGLTAALDNIRSAKLIDRIGFTRMGERDSIRPDGTVRRSLYWEMTADEWKKLWPGVS
jgi:RimJ/RimL family protein N-acetyltransferase